MFLAKSKLIGNTYFEIHHKITEWRDRAAERYQRQIPPTDEDQRWFDRHKRRFYHVRPARSGDHYVFDLCGHSPKGFLTIIRRDQCWVAVVALAELKFGPFVDSDAYACMRMDALIEELKGGAA